MPSIGTQVTLVAFWTDTVFGDFPISDAVVTFTPSIPSNKIDKVRTDASTFSFTVNTTGLTAGTYQAHFVGTSIVPGDAPFTDDEQTFTLTATTPPPPGTGIVIYPPEAPLFWLNQLGARTNVQTIEAKVFLNGIEIPTGAEHARVNNSDFTLTIDPEGLAPGVYTVVSEGTSYDGRELTTAPDDNKTFTITGPSDPDPGTGSGHGTQYVYPFTDPLFWANALGIRSEIVSVTGKVSQGGVPFTNAVFYERLADASGPGGLSRTSFAASVVVEGLEPGIYMLTTTAVKGSGSTLSDVKYFTVVGSVEEPPDDGSFPLFDLDDLADFTGRPRASFKIYSLQAIKQAVLLFKLATCRDSWFSSARDKELATNAILSVADTISLSQPYQRTLANPFQSQTIGSTSYSRLQKQIQSQLPTGVSWFDLAVERLGICDLPEYGGGIMSGSIHVFDPHPPIMPHKADWQYPGGGIWG